MKNEIFEDTTKNFSSLIFHLSFSSYLCTPKTKIIKL
jgi:hypothetical protein